MDPLTVCNVKEITLNNKLKGNYHQTLKFSSSLNGGF